MASQQEHIITTRDRARGALLGLPVGDALGTTLEFESPGTFEPMSNIAGGGPWRLQPGQWTDDTAMALCMAQSLIKRGGFDPHDQMERYVRWYRDGHLSSTGVCFDIGITTREALERFERTSDAYAGSTDRYAAGNGSIMRLAPVPVFYFGQSDHCAAIDRAGDSSRTTHGADTCVDACRHLATLIIGALSGMPKAQFLNYSHDAFLTDEIRSVAAGSYKRRNPPDIRGTGYVVESLEAAQWAFHHGANFREGCLLAVNLGDDADTTGAVYGQMAGAYYGVEGISAEWREQIAMRDVIVSFADRLLGLGHS